MLENQGEIGFIELNYLIKFLGDKDEVIMELKTNGDILVHGNVIENDKQVVDALREFIAKNKV